MLSLTDTADYSPYCVYATAEYGHAVAEEEGGVWKVLRDAEGEWQLPLVFRQIPGTDFFDAATPYGYGGFHIGGDFTVGEIRERWEEAVSILRDNRVVSLFLRFPPFFPQQVEKVAGLSGVKVRTVSQTILVPTGSEERMWEAMHSRSRTAVRSASKAGCRVEIVAADSFYVAEMQALYDQTMQRVGAASSYFFSDKYYKNLSKLGESLHVGRVVNSDGVCVAGSLILSDSKFAHYHLSGSTGTVSGANNLLLWGIMQWATEKQLEGFHLGGGLAKGDSLFKFKSSFGGSAESFSLGDVILLEEVYKDLVSARARELNVSYDDLNGRGFFPAYRVVN